MNNSYSTKKISILGTSGMLGYGLNEYFKRKGYLIEAIDRSVFDITKDSLNKLEEVISNSIFVINAMGIIKPRIDEKNSNMAYLVNGLFPRNLAKLTSKMGIPCFHITTDCVYSGAKGKYIEDDYFDINDTYGLSKCMGENYDCMCLRTSIIGEEINNKYSLLEWVRSNSGSKIPGYINHVWNGVTTIYLAEIINDIYTKNLYKPGTFHIFSPRSVTKYELVNIINKIYKLSIDVRKERANQNIDRSLSSICSLSKELVVKDLTVQIQEMHDFFNR